MPVSALTIFGWLMNYSIGANATSEELYSWAEEHVPPHLAGLPPSERSEAELLLRDWRTDRTLSEDDLYRLLVQSDLINLECPDDFSLRELVDRTHAALVRYREQV